MDSKSILIILRNIAIWRLLLIIFSLLSIPAFQLQETFLGGSLSQYVNNPLLWSNINFDGEHLLSIAYFGYKDLQYFFFPAYPLLVRMVAEIFGGSYVTYAVSGVVFSHILLIIALIGLVKLLGLDYKRKTFMQVIVLMLVFPTAFFLVSFYTESLFLAGVVWSFYFARIGKWGKSGLVGLVAAATRVIGIIIPLIIALEGLIKYKKDKRKKGLVQSFLAAFISTFGIAAYLFYLWNVTGDPLTFFHNVGIYGEQRSTALILFPQVFYRYFFKIWPATDTSFFPVVFTLSLETLTALVLLIVSILSIIKLRLSYTVYLILGFLIPTFSGSFSSLPRYAIVLFPLYILMGIYLDKLPVILRYTVLMLLIALQAITFALFTRGYWVA